MTNQSDHPSLEHTANTDGVGVGGQQGFDMSTEMGANWWTDKPKNEEAEQWRENQTHAFLALEHGFGQKSHIYSQDLRQLIQSLRLKNHQAAKASLADQLIVFKNLGRLTAQKWPLGGNYLEDTPLGYVLSDLFQTWAAVGCQGCVVTPPASGVVRWVTHKKCGERSYGHWSETLIVEACGGTGYYRNAIDLQQPWRTLRLGLEAFLDGWTQNITTPNGDGDTLDVGPTQGIKGPIGCCCLALRSIVTLNPRRLSQHTAERLGRLEQWTDQTARTNLHNLSKKIIDQQQAAWDRYLLERAGRMGVVPKKMSAPIVRKL